MPRYRKIVLVCLERVIEADDAEHADAQFARMSLDHLHFVEIAADTMLMRYDTNDPAEVPDDDPKAVWDLPPAAIPSDDWQALAKHAQRIAKAKRHSKPKDPPPAPTAQSRLDM